MSDDSPPRPEHLEPARRFRVRRTPNFVRFMLTGAVVGVLAGFVVDQATNDVRYGALSSFAFFGLGFAAVGVLLAALIAVLLDRR
ncbi:MAG TPA: hypothetical protein VFJ97_17710 [Dermatophilaceae bacterium]|nr:hypothetical protein [Dermatophilaceae bacterium]